MLICWWCRINAWIQKDLIIQALQMEQSMLLLEAQGATYQSSAKWHPNGVFTKIMTMDLANWQHLTIHLSSLSTRKAATEMYMIPSPYPGTTEMSWLVYRTVVNQPLWHIKLYLKIPSGKLRWWNCVIKILW